jgi:hypothetical protein
MGRVDRALSLPFMGRVDRALSLPFMGRVDRAKLGPGGEVTTGR